MNSSSEAHYQPIVFGTADYVSLCTLLVVSILIGVFSTICKTDNSVEEYLFGNRKLKVFPVSMSIMASLISSVTMTSGPTEFYRYGTDFSYIILQTAVSGFLICILFLPVFHNMKIFTVYEYLERRFSSTVRTFCSVIFTFNVVLSMPIVMCSCSLTLSNVCGINLITSTVIFGSITTFYTTIGGIRAVVWTDVIQAIFMFLGNIALAVKGTQYFHGFDKVWNENYERGRITPPNCSLSPTSHYTIWAWIFGGGLIQTVATGLNQGFVQRFVSVPTLNDAKRCVVLSMTAVILFNVITLYIGMLVVAMFADCDPVKSHKISAADQMTPLFMTTVLKDSPGVPGLITSALISGALSTLSTQLNSLAGIVLFDYYKRFIKKDISESVSGIVLKVAVVILGVIATVLSFFVKNFGSLVQVYYAMAGTLLGPIFGIFIIGLFLPKIKSKPTMIGSVIGLVLVSWISTGMNMAVTSGDFRYKSIPVSIDGCQHNFTAVISNATKRDVFVLYKISTLWYVPIGLIVTVGVACILSIFMENNDVSKMDKAVISPLIHRFLPETFEDSPETKMSLLKTNFEN